MLEVDFEIIASTFSQRDVNVYKGFRIADNTYKILLENDDRLIVSLCKDCLNVERQGSDEYKMSFVDKKKGSSKFVLQGRQVDFETKSLLVAKHEKGVQICVSYNLMEQMRTLRIKCWHKE